MNLIRRLPPLIGFLILAAYFLAKTQIQKHEEFVQEVWAHYQHKDTHALISDQLNPSALSKILPLNTVYLEVDDPDFKLGLTKLMRKDIEDKVASELGVRIVNTRGDAPQLHLLFREHEGFPFIQGNFILTKLTLTSGTQTSPEMPATDTVVYRVERRGIFETKDNVTLESSIDKAITHLKMAIGMVSSGQRPLRQDKFGNMYERPSKTIDGRLPPTKNQSK